MHVDVARDCMCPIKTSLGYSHCLSDECMWWVGSEDLGECAITQIAISLYNIETYLHKKED